MTTLNQINEFIESQPVAMVGVSRKPGKFGYNAFKELKEKGMKIIPVNPEAEEILGEKVFPGVMALPPEVKSIIVVTRKDQTAEVVREAREKGIKQVWIQQMSETAEAIDALRDSDINLVTGQCILMYYRPHSIHKFHRTLKKIFGRYPK